MDSRKRSRPFPENSGDMTRSKRIRLPVAFLSLTPEDRKAMERTACILNMPLDQLLPGLQAGQETTPGTTPLAQQPDTIEISQGVSRNEENEADTGNNDQTEANDNRDSASEGDVAIWHSSAAEFDNIDDDVIRDYENVGRWGEEFPVFFQTATAPIHVPTPGSNTQTATPMADGYHTQPAWNFSQLARHYVPYPSPWIGPLEVIDTGAPTPGVSGSPACNPQQQSWELIENTQQACHVQHSRQVPDGKQPFWPMDMTPVGPPAHPTPSNSSHDGVSNSDALHFVSVDPLQPQATGRPQRRGPFQDPERQQETGRTRGLKACVRCRMQKIRCSIVEDDPSGICGTCLAVSKQKVHSLPCLRHRLTECTLYRTGKAPGLEFTFRWPVMKLKNISDWESPNLRTIHVRSDVCEVALKLVVRRFVPIPHKDSIHRSWVDHRNGGIKKFKETTPYAIADMKNAVQDMREYVSTNVFKCMDFFLRGSDQLVKETYEFMRKYMQRVESEEERKLLGNFFRLWFAIRRTATTEHIVGDDTLDMEAETTDRSYPLFGKIPLPPVMIQQLDMVLTLGILEPLRKQVLEDFHKLALAANPRNWMTIYLVTFLSLHSCAKITDENYRNARKHGLLRRYAIPNFIADRHHSANVFLSHYHYRTESSNPFKQDWKKRHLTPFSHMSVDDIQFLERTKVLLKEREDKIRTNRENNLYEHELYFVSQMFEDNWQPRDTIIDRTDGTVNDVGLKVYAGDNMSGQG